MFRSWAVGPGLDCGQAMCGDGPVGSWDRPRGLGNQFGLGLDMSMTSGNCQRQMNVIWTIDENRMAIIDTEWVQWLEK